jgi:hypothetical protein
MLGQAVPVSAFLCRMTLQADSALGWLRLGHHATLPRRDAAFRVAAGGLNARVMWRQCAKIAALLPTYTFPSRQQG